MPRPLNRKCLECIDYSRQEAMRIHGLAEQGGDGCWHPKRCDRKRSHYRDRKENNAKQRQNYHEKKPVPLPETEKSIYIPVSAPPVALLYLYREKRQDAHLHAISVSIWQGNAKLAEIEPVHCLGMTNRQVNQFLRTVLQTLGDRYGITEFEPPIRMEPRECPLPECPLKEAPCTVGS
jgi:hypothetical protein